MIYSTADWIIRFMRFPSDFFVKAAVSTFVLVCLLLLSGWVIRFISDLVTRFVAIFGGNTVAFWFRNYMTYVGTIHHELSHALFVVLTGGKVEKITLIPKGKKLGSVDFRCRGNWFFRGLQMSLSAIAPVLCGAATLYLMSNYLYPLCSADWMKLLYFYLFISIFFHMTLSKQDMDNFRQGSVPLLLIVYVINLLCLFTKSS
jgi:hypothetical protein